MFKVELTTGSALFVNISALNSVVASSNTFCLGYCPYVSVDYPYREVSLSKIGCRSLLIDLSHYILRTMGCNK